LRDAGDDVEWGVRWSALVGGERRREMPTARIASTSGAVTGMQPAPRVTRLRRCAELAVAKAPWTCYPGIGKPGAERIALFTGTRAVLALDSNALRVLVRLGYGGPDGATYRPAQARASTQLTETVPARQRATSCCADTGRQSAGGPRWPAHNARCPTTAPAHIPRRDRAAHA
jgi:hypothetical protein